MTNLNFEPINPLAIENFSYLGEVADKLKGIVTSFISLDQYVSSRSGAVAKYVILVGANYFNTKSKDLHKLLSLSPSCTDLTNGHFLQGKDKLDYVKMNSIANIAQTLAIPDFTQFKVGRYSDLTDADLYEGWLDVIRSITDPDPVKSLAQEMCYDQVEDPNDEEIITGIFRKATDPTRYYIRGFVNSRTELAGAINPNVQSVNPFVMAKNIITSKLELMKGKFRNYHLRNDDCAIKVSGETITVSQTAEKVRTIIATNEAKVHNRLVKKTKSAFKSGIVEIVSNLPNKKIIRLIGSNKWDEVRTILNENGYEGMQIPELLTDKT